MTALDPRAYTPRAELRDVTLRDGLQLTAQDAAHRTQGARSPVNCWRSACPTLEIGSMARPDLVPPLADTLEVDRRAEPEELERCWIWVATPRHVEKAAAAGARNFQYCFSASDSHNKANIGRSHRGQRGGDARRGPDQPRGRRRDPAVHRHGVHLPVRGPDRSRSG